jgi:predicted CopG family antitoxin
MSKAILLDPDAYEALLHEKREDESFSEVIRARFGIRSTAADLRRKTASLGFAEETLDGIDEQIRARSQSPASSAGS